MPGIRNRMNGGPPGMEPEEICKSTWKELYRFVYYRVQNQEEAEDITQETYAKAFEYWTKHEITITNYSSFLKTIALNIIRDQWRSRKRKGQLIEIEKAEPEAMAVNDFSGETEDRALLTEAISKLPIEQQTVIRLRILQGYSSAETARQMNKKEGTVRVLQFRAIKALKSCWRSKWVIWVYGYMGIWVYGHIGI